MLAVRTSIRYIYQKGDTIEQFISTVATEILTELPI